MGNAQKQSGFTIIELIVAIVLVIASAILVVQQKSQIQRVDRDRERKTAINAMYYSLEESYKPQKGAYPRLISKDNLKSMDPALFTDPDGKTLGDKDSDYTYDPTGCEADVCRGYTLRAQLESEAEYTKKSP